VPRECDCELGFGFVRAADEVHVSRCIDTRCMTPETLRRFETAVRMTGPNDEPDPDDVDRCMTRLKTMLAYCDEGRPSLEFSDWVEVTPADDEGIGPGWSDTG
jgi:hypothetical protein